MLRAIEIYAVMLLGSFTIYGLIDKEKEGLTVALLFCPILVYFVMKLFS